MRMRFYLVYFLFLPLCGFYSFTGCSSPLPSEGITNSDGSGDTEKVAGDTPSTEQTVDNAKPEPIAEPLKEPLVEPAKEPAPVDASEPTPEVKPEPPADTNPPEPTPERQCQPGESRGCYSGPQGTEGIGACKQGLQICKPDGTWGDCQGEVLPQAQEICGNKIDDNCDGKTDAEDTATCKCNPGQTQECYTGPAGTEGVGACKKGQQTCDANSTWGACQGEVLPQAQEICGNKIDDNCDGKTDTEDAAACECDPNATRPCYTGPQGSENQGECKAGTQTCKADGKWDNCQGDVLPTSETCNGKDDDCNGQTDDVASGQSLCPVGQSCVNGKCDCDATSCPNGCCKNGACVAPTSNTECGTGGAACTDCGQGRACVNGKCECNATSCPNGCCDANGQCQAGNSNASCGTGGVACKACPSGQGCDTSSQVCGCGPSTCSTGCCNSAGQCVTSSVQNCGVGGKACAACSTTTSSVCDTGVCKCGSNAECAAGQRCSNGQCVCDATSCSNGCCDGTTCVTNRTTSLCANNGAKCGTCDTKLADNCSTGSCRCGTSAPCTGKSSCKNGSCQCEGPSVSNVTINSAAYTGTPIKVAPGTTVNLGMAYRLSQVPGCPGCIDQLVVGIYTPGYGSVAGSDCVYNGSPALCPSETTGNKSLTVVAPRSPGIYDIRLIRDLQFNCNDARNNFNKGTHANAPVVARIEVTQPTCGSLSNAVFNVSINGGGKEATVSPGATVTVKADYRLSQLNGCSCVVQLVAGLIGGAAPTPIDCVYNGVPSSCPNGASGSKTMNFTAPLTPGTYFIRWSVHLEFTCANALPKFAGANPGQELTIGVLIVK